MTTGNEGIGLAPLRSLIWVGRGRNVAAQRITKGADITPPATGHMLKVVAWHALTSAESDGVGWRAGTIDQRQISAVDFAP